MTMSIVHLLVVTFILTTVQAEVSTAYMSSDHCAEDVVKKVKETNPQLATDFSLSNRLASNSLRVICTNYVQNNIHKVLRAVNGVTCLTQVDVPTIGELDNGIYNAYVTILKQLSIYAASPTTKTISALLTESVTRETNQLVLLLPEVDEIRARPDAPPFFVPNEIPS